MRAWSAGGGSVLTRRSATRSDDAQVIVEVNYSVPPGRQPASKWVSVSRAFGKNEVGRAAGLVPAGINPARRACPGGDKPRRSLMLSERSKRIGHGGSDGEGEESQEVDRGRLAGCPAAQSSPPQLAGRLSPSGYSPFVKAPGNRLGPAPRNKRKHRQSGPIHPPCEQPPEGDATSALPSTLPGRHCAL